MRVFGLLASMLFGASAVASDYNAARAHYHYQMFCQGCHTPDGTGAGSVPRMKDHVGIFLNSERGRAYLVQVPGSATSVLSDDHLAEVLNWMIEAFAGDSLDPEFKRYRGDEVGVLRASPLNETVNLRAAILAELAAEQGATAR